jgi:hypothetical protein
VNRAPDLKKLAERGEISYEIEQAGPTVRELVDAFGEDSLYVTVAGVEYPGSVRADGVAVSNTYPQVAGAWRVAIHRPDFSEGRNALRRALYHEMYRKKVALETEDMERKHDTTNHVLWRDPDGEQRAAPEDSADHVIAKTGLKDGTHPKTWRPSA